MTNQQKAGLVKDALLELKKSAFTAPYKRAGEKVKFNWLAFLFSSAYFAGYGKLPKGLLLAVLGCIPFTLLCVMGYSGWHANKELPIKKQKFHWPYAIIVYVIHAVLLSQVSPMSMEQ